MMLTSCCLCRYIAIAILYNKLIIVSLMTLKILNIRVNLMFVFVQILIHVIFDSNDGIGMYKYPQISL